MGFGVAMLFVLAFGHLVLGPKRLHIMLAYVERARAELENATRGYNPNSTQNSMLRLGLARPFARANRVGCKLCLTPESAPKSRNLQRGS